MRIAGVLAVFITVFAFARPVVGEQEHKLEAELSVAKWYSFHSQVLNEQQSYSVFLPSSYDSEGSSQSYPVIYVLDGYNTQLLAVASTMRALNQFGAEAPEAIVVGLPSNHRNRDYTPVHSVKGPTGDTVGHFKETGGAEAYRHFMRTEMLPHIEGKYRTKPHRILVGHSFGGLFALNDMLHENRMFGAYIAIDPVFYFGDRYLESKIQEMASKGIAFDGRIFMTTVPHDDDGLDSASAELFLQELKNSASRLAQAHRQHHETLNHQSVQSASYYDGLKYVFEGYAPPDLETVARNPDVLIKHYANYSNQVGADYAPDHSYLTMAAYNAMWEYKLPHQAFRLFMMNVDAYPGHSTAWAGLGDYHAEVGDIEHAVEAFDRAIELNEFNTYAARRLSEVRQK